MSGEEWHEYQDEDDEDLGPGFDIDSNEYYYDGCRDSDSRIFRVKVDHERGRLTVEFGPGYMSINFEDRDYNLAMINSYQGWANKVSDHAGNLWG